MSLFKTESGRTATIPWKQIFSMHPEQDQSTTNAGYLDKLSSSFTCRDASDVVQGSLGSHCIPETIGGDNNSAAHLRNSDLPDLRFAQDNVPCLQGGDTAVRTAR